MTTKPNSAGKWHVFGVDYPSHPFAPKPPNAVVHDARSDRLCLGNVDANGVVEVGKKPAITVSGGTEEMRARVQAAIDATPTSKFSDSIVYRHSKGEDMYVSNCHFAESDTLYLSLHTSDPGDEQEAHEVSWPGYERPRVGRIEKGRNAETIRFPTCTRISERPVTVTVTQKTTGTKQTPLPGEVWRAHGSEVVYVWEVRTTDVRCDCLSGGDHAGSGWYALSTFKERLASTLDEWRAVQKTPAKEYPGYERVGVKRGAEGFTATGADGATVNWPATPPGATYEIYPRVPIKKSDFEPAIPTRFEVGHVWSLAGTKFCVNGVSDGIADIVRLDGFTAKFAVDNIEGCTFLGRSLDEVHAKERKEKPLYAFTSKSDFHESMTAAQMNDIGNIYLSPWGDWVKAAQDLEKESSNMTNALADKYPTTTRLEPVALLANGESLRVIARKHGGIVCTGDTDTTVRVELERVLNWWIADGFISRPKGIDGSDGGAKVPDAKIRIGSFTVPPFPDFSDPLRALIRMPSRAWEALGIAFDSLASAIDSKEGRRLLSRQNVQAVIDAHRGKPFHTAFTAGMVAACETPWTSCMMHEEEARALGLVLEQYEDARGGLTKPRLAGIRHRLDATAWASRQRLAIDEYEKARGAK